MGGVLTLEDNLEENQCLRQFVGLEPISDNDPFWNRLLSYNLKINALNRNELKRFNESLASPLQSLMYNTQTTGNFAAFIRMFLRRAVELNTSEICQNTIFLWQMSNALIILRHICLFLTQRLSESEFVKVFDKCRLSVTDNGVSEPEESDEEVEREKYEADDQYENTAEELLNALVKILIELPFSNKTQAIHIEAVKCILALLSSQLYQDNVQCSPMFFSYMMTGHCSKKARQFAKCLLTNYLQHNMPYEKMVEKEPESIVISLATSVWSMVQSATGYDAGLTEEEELDSITPSSLGSLSVLLLLNLACHQTSSSQSNAYKDALAEFQNAQEVSSMSNIVSGAFALDYSALYDRLCATVNEQPPMLLLYLLLHRNSGFRNFILSRINLENLVIPVLRVLHDGLLNGSYPSSNSHHVYLALIVILILSEDDFFCKIIHETVIKDSSWFQFERPLGQETLGGLIILVFVRTIQTNTLKTRDRYLHTNCLATLANMSSSFKQLSDNVCQKLIGLLESLTKRHAKLIEHMRMSAEYDLINEKQTHNYHQDITALEEGIRTILEMCNSCLTMNLRHNPRFIYTILYHRTLFDSYHNHPMFQDLIWNISAVLNYFAGKIQTLSKGASVAEVLDVIEKGALQWPTDRLKKFPELKFKYVEDDNTVDFFVPYVWRLVLQSSTMYWELSRVKLFNALLP
ncbi:hypothetical protein AB6A40_001824 [Gnathostoma spinigerum]|uniref:Dymeclin n=1 Tax=Gnathostoma spinigerum TaxID=75299 RepID=A0ABD6E637_9BILA